MLRNSLGLENGGSGELPSARENLGDLDKKPSSTPRLIGKFCEVWNALRLSVYVVTGGISRSTLSVTVTLCEKACVNKRTNSKVVRGKLIIVQINYFCAVAERYWIGTNRVKNTQVLVE